MKKIIIPIFTASVFLLFLTGITFIETDSDLYLTSNIFRFEPIELKPGFRFIPPVIFNISKDIPEKDQIQLHRSQPKSINLRRLSEIELHNLLFSLYLAKDYHAVISICLNKTEQEYLNEDILIILADSLINKDYFYKSLYYLYMALDLNINNDKIYFLLSKSYYSIGNFHNAAEMISQALYLNPYDKDSIILAFDIYLELEEFYKCRYLLDKLRPLMHWPEEEKYLRMAIEYHLFHNFDLEMSRSYLVKLKDSNTNQQIINLFSGIIEHYEGNYIRSIELLQRDDDIIADNYFRLLYLSKSYAEMGMFKDALSNTEALLKNAPNKGDILFYLSNLYLNAGNINKSIDNLLLMDFTHMQKYYPKAFDILLQAEKYDECVILLEKILLLKPNNFQIKNHLGLIYFRKKDYLESLKYYEKSIELFPFQKDIIKKIGDIKELLIEM